MPRRHPIIQIYGAALNKESGEASGSMVKFSQSLGERIDKQVVLDVTGEPQTLSWGVSGNGDSQDHDASLVLQHITQQTGLTSKEEIRKVRRLFITAVN